MARIDPVNAMVIAVKNRKNNSEMELKSVKIAEICGYIHPLVT